ncbi:SpoIIE family protein phosphatase [Actinacidiphila glaucinigra]|uniref:SpoIIE family protein phosphatase n=1 Tax=Actinacidiphila glaucinigra TaxID=235986 RepID=UPI002DDAE31A|nr:SpoIIE family protein phosphatase [Actinacidiphila glaucinigra]WSD57746.1 SpoIIE family protein phosphatase [Actinacidiphila glaucinigra]
MNVVQRHGVRRPAAGLGRLTGLFGRLVRETDAAVGMLYVLPPGERVLELVALSGMSRRIAAPWARMGVGDATPVADAVRQRRLVWVGGPDEMARRYPLIGLMAPFETVLAAAPVAGQDRVWGGVCLVWPLWHPPEPSRIEREAISGFCRRAGRLSEQAAAHGHPLLPASEPVVLAPNRSRTPGRGEAMGAYDFAERLPVGCCSLDLDGQVTFLNTAAAELLGVGAADLLGARPWERLLWLGDPAFEDRYRAALMSRKPTAFTAIRPPDRRLSFRLTPGATGVSVRITPADTAAETGPPSPQGALGALPLYHLMHLATALTEAVSVKDVVDRVTDQVVPAFEAQGLALLTVEDGRLRIAGYRGYAPEFMARFDGEPLTSPTPIVRALATQTPRFFTSYDDFRRAYPQAPRYGDRDAWAFLPLIATGRPVGLLVLSYDQPRSFTLAERTILTSLAGLIGQVLDRARLYDTQHQLARTLQDGLLPQELPTIPGLEVAARYLPAGHGADIGGDFYDLIRCGPHCAAITIGDVQGHNVQAAALMGQVRTAVHAHATSHLTPGTVLARTNRLVTDLNPGLFTSCLYGHLDLARHNARLATAGHHPPLIRYPDGHTESLHLPPGLLLGITPDSDYPTTAIPLQLGTVLALYTDGLVEAPGIDTDRTTADLARHLTQADDDSADHLADTLLHHALQTVPGTDDIALLVVRVNS